MECEVAAFTPAAADIPSGYVQGVAIRAYHLDIVLDVKRATYSGEVEISLDVKPGPSLSVFYLHAAPGLYLSASTVNGIPAAIVRDKSSLTHVARIELAEGASPCSGATAIKVKFAGCMSKTRTDGIYMMTSGGAGKKTLRSAATPPDGLGGREDQGQGKTKEDEEDEDEEEEEDGEEDEEEGGGRWGGGGGGEKGGGNGDGGGDGAADPLGGDDATAETTAASASAAAAAATAAIVIGTHLEPTHARELFPCVDLPSSKAVFCLTLRGVPRHLQAISNTPKQRSEDENGTTTVTFQRTPNMPTYVFGFWVGNFHCISTRAPAIAAVQNSGTAEEEEEEGERQEEEEEKEKEKDDEKGAVLINVHVVKGVSLEGAEFALNLASRVFDLFSRLFSVRYPMPKLDLIALPSMHGLGMENFGAITFLQEYLLVTADTTFVRRRRIARLICHEVSHMWYGDIVTPESFDELWLKEGMARFLEYLAVDSLDSSYHVWNNFMSEVFFQAMLADSQEDNHPVVQEHNGDIASILESFDTITYCKGASVLRMLSFCVGHERFLEGMGALIATHQYGCANQEDLWKAVQGVCDRDGVELNVRDVMQPWLTRPKFPVLRVRVEGGSLHITQQPFSFFALPDRATTGSSGDGGFDPPTAAKAPPPACEEDGATAGGTSEDPGARSPKLPRTGAPAPGGPPLDGSAPAHARSRPEPAAWPIPLRIRAAAGSRSPPDSAARAEEGAGGGAPGNWACGRRRRRRRPGEEVFCVLMAEAATSVALPDLSGEPAAAGGSADGGQGEEGRPYLVVNDGHSGFFTVQYECERSWRLALDAVREGVLNECETMGFVNDLILPLHEGALIDRRAASLSLSRRREEGRGGGDGNLSCDVPCLFARLASVVRLLGRDRSHPAWSTGQLFIWELLIMCATSELGEIYELSRKRSLQHETSAEETTGRAGGRPVAGSSPRGVSNQHAGNTSVEADRGQTNRGSVVAGSCGVAGDEGAERLAGESDGERSGAEGSIAAAARRLRSIAADVEAAFDEAEEHVRWHVERVASGVQQASEALKSLREMRDRLHRSRAQLTWAQQNGVLEEA